jgi:hypothetical protein
LSEAREYSSIEGAGAVLKCRYLPASIGMSGQVAVVVRTVLSDTPSPSARLILQQSGGPRSAARYIQAPGSPQPELKSMNPPMPRAMQKSPSISNCSLVESRIGTRLKRSRIRNVLVLGPFVYASLQKIRPIMMMAGAMTHLTNHSGIGG